MNTNFLQDRHNSLLFLQDRHNFFAVYPTENCRQTKARLMAELKYPTSLSLFKPSTQKSIMSKRWNSLYVECFQRDPSQGFHDFIMFSTG